MYILDMHYEFMLQLDLHNRLWFFNPARKLAKCQTSENQFSFQNFTIPISIKNDKNLKLYSAESKLHNERPVMPGS